MKKWELSLLFAVVVTVLCCALRPVPLPQWWTTAFAPLCDGILTARADCGDCVLRSKFWELISNAAF